ncbi:unnamed protein product [Spirodela intermedia]|uniref:Auxin-responsive protein n=1 Tax=Spirodela intermedia TaxID=51605 RepID=A0A7I8KIE3_SPIIN|nr:unnamed protein product [Spirodela intermedia]
MAGGEAIMTELRLGPPGAAPESEERRREKMKKRAFPAVGWPPVCSYRRRRATGDWGEKKKKKKKMEEEKKKKKKTYVKVSMDGAPFLRKLELDACEGYAGLTAAVDELFGVGGLAQNEFSLIYEDKEGDWLLVGDVPWKMFTATCKRLRSMKKSEGKITATSGRV